jgi:glutathione S-transferase
VLLYNSQVSGNCYKVRLLPAHLGLEYERREMDVVVPRRERYSIADISLYAYTHVADEGGIDRAGYPAIRAWLERVAGQPGHVPITA